MTVEVKVPGFPESVSDGTLTQWHKQPGDSVRRDEVLVDIETDKVVFEVPSPCDGVVTEILEEEGATVVSAQLLAKIDETQAVTDTAEASQPVAPDAPAAEPVPDTSAAGLLTPSAEKMIKEKQLDAAAITGTGKGGRVLKEDVIRHLQKAPSAATPTAAAPPVAAGERIERRVPMSRLRARIAERLLEAQHNAAILSTFNEVNMQPVMSLRSQYKDKFAKQYGVKLGFMSFFIKATVEALKKFPEVNASMDGDDVVYHGYFDIGVAVGSPRGLVVPILRDCDQMSMMEIESQITGYAERAKKGTLEMHEITGGTFTITNGGVFGSMLSTPILNPPQSAILGMHKIQERAMVEDGEVVIKPMMYLAVSYDHRVIDGREAVQFLVTIKEMLEDPARMLLGI
ncbi:MAG: 2-oxoglutarate dehydrogenase complex dihydrolipoyllysine-residue succinyltransferase [Gammaproteobacteria bacterium]|nr:MAG: 2-oxoglutarate dehydrogenase complex dihydrolipoyllysine-residue succinyltransferase [Gammaproteobacteria bacterium]